MPALAVVIASRPPGKGASSAFVPHLGDRGERGITLGALERRAVERLVDLKLGITAAPAPLYDFVFRRAAGHPLYTEELVLGLRAGGSIEITGAACRLATDSLENLELAVPNTLQGVIVSRVDRLDPAEQFVLKVASVTGTRFSAAMIAEVLPVPHDRARLEGILERLAAEDFIACEDAATGAYGFKHVLVQQAIYDLLLFEQRQLLHRRVADWLEAHAPGGPEAACTPLALHWERAGHAGNAVRYLEMAAGLALRRYSIGDAIAHGLRALTLTDERRLLLPAARRARLSVILGDAYHELFDYEKAAHRFEEALAYLSWPIPKSRFGLALRTAAHAAAQLGRRLGLFGAARAAGAARACEAAHIYERLAEIAYFDSRSLELLHCTLASLNHAEASNSTREIVDGYAALSIGLGTAGLRRPAAFYNRRSLALAEAQGAMSDIAYAQLVNMVFAASQGLWDRVEGAAARASPLFLQLGATIRWQQVQATLCFARLTRGDLDGAVPLIAELKRSLENANTPAQVHAWTLGAELIVEIAHDRCVAALARSADAMALDPTIHRADRLLCHGLAALAHLRNGDAARAAATADLALANLTESLPSAWHVTHAVAGLAETYLELGAPRTKSGMEAKARAACDALRGFARRIPVATPSALLLRSRHAALTGRLTQARRLRRRALVASQRYGIALAAPPRNAIGDEAARLDRIEAGKAGDAFG
jgi:adenylate cyclase